MIENNKINEASEQQLLSVYLNSRGINPKFVTTDTKISHAKSAEFAKWKVDHQNDKQFTEEEIKENDTSEKEEMVQAQLHFIKYACEEILDYIDKGGEVEEWYQVKIAKSFSEFESLHSFMEGEARRLGLKEESEQIDELAPETLASYVLKTTSKDPKRAEPRKKAMSKLAKIMAKRSFSEEKKPKMTALDKFRASAAQRARKHDDIEREMKARHAAGKEDMKGAIDRLEKQLNKEESVVNEMDTYPHPDSKEGKALMKAFKSSAKKDPTDLNAPGKSPTVKQTTSALLPMLNKSFKKSMKKEETINEVSKSEVDHHFDQWTNSEHAPYNSDAGDDNKVHQSALSYLSSTNVPKEKHEKLAMHIAHKFHGSGIDEESEPITELKKSTVFSWLKQQPVVPEKKPGMSRKDHNKKIKSHSKSWNRALDRLSGYKPTSEETENVSEVFSTGVQGHISQATLDSIKNKRNVKVNLGTPSYSPKPKTLAKKPSKKASFISRLLNKEDTWQDSYAATQTTGMEIVDLPADEKYNKRKEMSKSARMIKSLYKNKGVKEGVDGQSGGGIMYDKEKTDKLETPYGKKPSMTRADKKMATGDKEPQAAAVLTGGKTLTGQDRDTLEIDPLMRKPGPLDQNKKT
jgi:hypothetical protein